MEKTTQQTLTLTPRLRRELKHPLGTLLKGAPKDTMKKLGETILKQKPECIISVGDVVSQNMLAHGIQPHIVIVDNQVMRKSSKPIKTRVNRKVHVRNPAGTLTPETWVVIEQALKQKQPTQVVVEGEEDLMALVAVLKAPENSLIIYGQPHEGVVVVKADMGTKEKVSQIVEDMVPLPKS